MLSLNSLRVDRLSVHDTDLGLSYLIVNDLAEPSSQVISLLHDRLQLDDQVVPLLPQLVLLRFGVLVPGCQLILGVGQVLDLVLKRVPVLLELVGIDYHVLDFRSKTVEGSVEQLDLLLPALGKF